MLDAYRDLIDELLGTPSEIRAIVESSGEGGVSPAAVQLIAAIRDRDRAILARAQSMTQQPNAYLSELRLDEPSGDLALQPLLEEMETARGDLVSLLINLSLKDWERVAVHETAGEVTLSEEIEEHVEFDEAQRQRLRDLMSSS